MCNVQPLFMVNLSCNNCSNGKAAQDRHVIQEGSGRYLFLMNEGEEDESLSHGFYKWNAATSYSLLMSLF